MNQEATPERDTLRKRILEIQGAPKKGRRGSRFFNAVLAFSGWGLAGTLVLAPWLYGGTRPWTIAFLTSILLLITGIWLISALFAKNDLKISRTLVLISALLLAQGWWMTFNAQFVYDTEYSLFSPAPALSESAPGSVDRPSSMEMMRRITALIGVILMASHLGQARKWRMRFWWAVCLSGVSIITLGLIQKLAQAPMIFWETGRPSHYFFATYLYHGNAGAFINLILPLVAGMTAYVFQKGHKVAMTLIAPGAAICIAGAFSHASKAGMVIGIFLLVIILCWQTVTLLRSHQTGKSKAAGVVSLSVGVGAAVLIVIAAGWHFAAQRWQLFDVSLDARRFTYETCERIIPDAGAFGFGPGTFSIMFDRYAVAENPRMPVFYRYAHQDYQQAVIEWGWVGSMLMGLLFGGALLISLSRFFFSGHTLRSSDRLLLFSVALALMGVALHAAVDFPLQILSLQLLAALYVGLAWGSFNWQAMSVEKSKKADVLPSRRKRSRRKEACEIEKFNQTRRDQMENMTA